MNKKYNFYNVLFIFILGTLLHFTYNWSNNNFIVGLFSSTNESIFSHTKLLILPTFIFYILFYKKNKFILNKNKFFSSMIIQLISSILSMILIYYTARFGFNIENLWFDIFLFFLSIVIGLTLSIHYYKYSKKSINYKIWSLIIIGLMIIFTINPLNFPFFILKKARLP